MTIFLIIASAVVLLFVFKTAQNSKDKFVAPSEPVKKPYEPVIDLSDKPHPDDKNGTK